MVTAEALIEHFDLEPLHGEGGLYTQTYLSPESIAKVALPDRFAIDKPFGTAIFYLLTSDANSFSAMHLLPTDEIYHFYLGDPVELLQLYSDGRSERIILGPDILGGQRVQYVAPHGVWQGSHVMLGGRFALMGTTMAPGYTDEDYVAGDRRELIEQYPQEADLIQRLTRPSTLDK